MVCGWTSSGRLGGGGVLILLLFCVLVGWGVTILGSVVLCRGCCFPDWLVVGGGGVCILVVLDVSGWYVAGGGLLGPRGGVGDRPLVGNGVGSCSNSKPHSWLKTGNLSFTFLFFLVDLVGGEVDSLLVLVWSPTLFLDGDSMSPLSRFTPPPLISIALLNLDLSVSHSLTILSS